MMMMITGEERQEGSGVGHISPPSAVSSLIFSRPSEEEESVSQRGAGGRGRVLLTLVAELQGNETSWVQILTFPQMSLRLLTPRR